MLKLTQRDIAILAAIERWGVLGIGQLDVLFYRLGRSAAQDIAFLLNRPDRSIYGTAFYQRLRRIRDAGLITALDTGGLPRVYCLTGKGHAVLGRLGASRFPSFRSGIRREEIEHEMLMIGAGLLIEKRLGLPVRCERERSRNRAAMQEMTHEQRLTFSDLWISGTPSCCPKAIEIERTQKSKKRYFDIFEAYTFEMPRGGVVCYLTAEKVQAQRLLRYAEECRAEIVFAAAFTDFMASSGRCAFANYDGRRLHLWSASGAEARA